MPNPDFVAVAFNSVLSDSGDPREGLRPLVDAVANDPRRYPADYHVLGFLHCRLAQQEGRTLRLHVWPQSERSYAEPVWPVHTHHWTISSAVIAGHVVNETFDVRPDDHGLHQIYEVRYVGDGISERQRTDQRVSVVANLAERWNAGSRYDVPLNTFHSTTVPDGVFGATVIVTGTRTEAPPQVLGQSTGEPQYRYVAEGVKADHWGAVLSELQRSLYA